MTGLTLQKYISSSRLCKLAVDCEVKDVNDRNKEVIVNVYIASTGGELYSRSAKCGYIEVNGSMHAIKGTGIFNLGSNEVKLIKSVSLIVNKNVECIRVKGELEVGMTLDGEYVPYVDFEGVLIL